MILTNAVPQRSRRVFTPPLVRELVENDRHAALMLLAEDPVRGVHLRGMIEDNGLQSVAHRGCFYGYYEGARMLGVALLGHYIICYGSDAAFAAFAELAASAKSSMIFGPKPEVESFWQQISLHGRQTKEVHTQQWLVCKKAALPLGSLQLRRANLTELAAVADAHAEIIRAECGYDPYLKDREGFTRRVQERIERGRTWVKMQGDAVIFKAELVSVTPEAVYLEGIWTHPAHRGQGLAKSCMSELLHRLLRKHKAVCLVVDEENTIARRVYEHVGFVYANSYQVRYLQPLT